MCVSENERPTLRDSTSYVWSTLVLSHGFLMALELVKLPRMAGQ